MSSIEEMDVSLDHFYRNRVKIYQNRKGYRFSVDSPILADFIPKSAGDILEIGSGSGVISFLLLFSQKIRNVRAVEIQPSLCTLAKRSSELNGFSDKFELFCGDFNEIYKKFEGSDVIFSNPPYLKINTGRLSANSEVRTAKFETRLRLDDLLTKSCEILKEKGDIFLIFPYSRFDELVDISEQLGLTPVKLRKIFSFSDGKPERFLIQLSNYGKRFEELSPLVIYDKPGIYSKEMDSVLAGIKYDKKS